MPSTGIPSADIVLTAIIHREFSVVRGRIGDFDLWVRADPIQQEWDLQITRPILEGDEYELLPIHNDGHRVETVVDVGGHIGSFSLRAKSIWPEATILAVEADPETAEVFRLNTSHLRGIHFYPVAVGAPGRDQVRFAQAGRDRRGDGNTGASFVIDAVQALGAESLPRNSVCVVQAATLSDLLRRNGIDRIDILKLDCEGSEPEILQDLKNNGLLDRTGWIRGEWHHPASIPLIESALRATHIYSFAPTSCPWGFFIAHRRDLSR